MRVTAYDLAQRFVGAKEVPGGRKSNPAILSMLTLDSQWPEDDSVPWCSAFVNYIAWLLRLPRSKSLRARSWLTVGTPVGMSEAKQGFDVVILKRGKGNQPGAEVLDAPGHVGFYSSRIDNTIFLLGGNQGDAVSISGYPAQRILGIRRLG